MLQLTKFIVLWSSLFYSTLEDVDLKKTATTSEQQLVVMID